MIGGLIAFLVLQLRADQLIDPPASIIPRNRRWWHWAAAAMLAMLWSATVTIVLSRLAQAQLPIQVTVSDVWGAVTIGLFAQYLGVKWLENLLQPSGQAMSGRATKVGESAKEDAIRQRAHELYLTRGRSQGSDLDDWLQAEREVQGEPTAKGR
jgi:hypothetical protein